jgi:hypothetical protein
MHAQTNNTDFNHSPSVGILHVMGIIVKWAVASWQRYSMATACQAAARLAHPDS